jgi:shikimate kinase
MIEQHHRSARATLWLVGMMGVGKTTVGRLVAVEAGVAFVDLDEDVEADAAVSIPEIFDRSGEPEFRRLEAAAVTRVAGRHCVVATGGGVVTQPAATERMRGTGLVVWLDAPASVLAERVGDGWYRPMLAGDDPAAAMASIAADRAVAYAAAAHHRVDVSGRSPEAVAEEVSALWTRS